MHIPCFSCTQHAMVEQQPGSRQGPTTASGWAYRLPQSFAAAQQMQGCWGWRGDAQRARLQGVPPGQPDVVHGLAPLLARPIHAPQVQDGPHPDGLHVRSAAQPSPTTNFASCAPSAHALVLPLLAYVSGHERASVQEFWT